MKFKLINNESGSTAILGAVIFTIAITTLLSSFYIYSVNQSKGQARIKEGSQMINVMESIATKSRQAYDLAESSFEMGRQADLSSLNCDDGNPPQNLGGRMHCRCPDTSAPQNVGGGIFACFTAGDRRACITREDSGETFCANMFGAVVSNDTTSIQNVVQREDKRPQWAKKWLSNLNMHFISPALHNTSLEMLARQKQQNIKLKLLDWYFAKKQAFAFPAGEEAQDITVGTRQEQLGGETQPAAGEGDTLIEVVCLVNPNDEACNGAEPRKTSYFTCNNRDATLVHFDNEGATAVERDVTNTNLCERCNPPTLCSGVQPQATDATALNDALSAQRGLEAKQNFIIVQ